MSTEPQVPWHHQPVLNYSCHILIFSCLFRVCVPHARTHTHTHARMCARSYPPVGKHRAWHNGNMVHTVGAHSGSLSCQCVCEGNIPQAQT